MMPKEMTPAPAMAKATAEHERALGFGVAAAAGQITAGIAALIAAPVYDSQGQFFVFALLAAGVAVVGAVGYALLVGSRDDVPQPVS